jgi:hypothetical protein
MSFENRSSLLPRWRCSCKIKKVLGLAADEVYYGPLSWVAIEIASGVFI